MNLVFVNPRIFFSMPQSNSTPARIMFTYAPYSPGGCGNTKPSSYWLGTPLLSQVFFPFLSSLLLFLFVQDERCIRDIIPCLSFTCLFLLFVTVGGRGRGRTGDADRLHVDPARVEAAAVFASPAVARALLLVEVRIKTAILGFAFLCFCSLVISLSLREVFVLRT